MKNREMYYYFFFLTIFPIGANAKKSWKKIKNNTFPAFLYVEVYYMNCHWPAFEGKKLSHIVIFYCLYKARQFTEQVKGPTLGGTPSPKIWFFPPNRIQPRIVPNDQKINFGLV